MSETNVEQKSHLAIVDQIRKTAPAAIGELSFVKEKFIANYNATHREKSGDLVYHRQLMHFKQLISASDQLKGADPFSLYACFLTAAVNGDSLDPNDEETYLIPLKGKAYLWPQVKSRVKRLKNSGQINFADQAQLVYEGDLFEVESGRVTRHVGKFVSEKVIAAYVRFVLDEKGTDKFFIYRASDWLAWKKKSTQATGDNWSGGSDGQPLAAFLRTKVIKHACSDKSWSSARFNPSVQQFNVEVDDPGEIENQITQEGKATDVTHGAPVAQIETTEDSFAPEDTQAAAGTVVINPDQGEGEGF